MITTAQRSRLRRLFNKLEMYPGESDEALSALGLEKTREWLRRCHNRPVWWEIGMEAANELLEGYGVEAILADDLWKDHNHHGVVDCGVRCMDIAAVYVNMGDTYAPTLIRYHQAQRFRWNVSVGDFIEHAPKGWRF